MKANGTEPKQPRDGFEGLADCIKRLEKAEGEAEEEAKEKEILSAAINEVEDKMFSEGFKTTVLK